MTGKVSALIPNFKPFVPKESIDRVVKTLKSSWIGGDGPAVKQFERKIAKIIKNKNVLEVHRRNDLYLVFAERGFGALPGVTYFNDNHLIIPVGHWVSRQKAKEIAQILASF